MDAKGRFDIRKDEGLITIFGHGELSLHLAPQLRSLLEDAVKCECQIVVDLTQAQYIDTAILMALVAAGKSLSTSGQKLRVVVSDNSHPQYVLRIIGLPTVLEVAVAD